MKSAKRRTATKHSAGVAMGGPAVTLDMVAREAGVSASTVSRILNGTARVRDAKTRAVHAAIAKLQFLPNPLAQSLARGKTMQVGVVTQSLASPFYAEALGAVEAGLQRANYSPQFTSGHWRDVDERRCIESLLNRRVEGIICVTSCLPDAELVKLSKRLPLVIIGRHIAAERTFCLDYDNIPSARLATEYLIGQGHRRIAFIAGPADRADAQQRLKGYKAALAASGIPYQPRLVAAGNYYDGGGYNAMNQLLDSGAEFTAVFAANDQSAYGAMLALHRHGRLVPRDVSVVGFDDLPGSAFTIPPLTSVHRSIDEVGHAAAEAMIDMIEGREPSARALEATLAIRESTRPLHP
jgi:LacI family transcriptional regulator, galactose operon repressor